MGDDWTLADTSPREPPSGSFGPAIDSLSLGGGGGGSDSTHSQQDLLPTLFPELGDQPMPFGFDAFSSNSQSPPSSQPLGASSSTYTENTVPSNTAASTMLPPDPRPMQTDPTPAQEATARQQVQRDLQGVDQRALRGPLRALAQQGPQTPLEHKVSQSQVESALKAAVDSFVAEADANRHALGNARAPGPGGTSALGDLNQDQRSLLFPGVKGTAPNAQPVVHPPRQAPDAASFHTKASAPSRPSVGPRKRSNSFDVSFLPATTPWFSQSPPQAPALSALQPAQNGPSQPSGTGMGTGTGWTGQPTNNLNAFDLGGIGFDPSRANIPQRRPMTRDRSGLTVSPQETFLNFSADDASLMANIAAWQGGVPGDKTNAALSHDKPPLLRGETVRPSAQQLQHMRGTSGTSRTTNAPSASGTAQSSKPRTMTSASSASSDLSLISPASSDTTNEDDDERPFSAFRPNVVRPSDYDAILKQQQQNLQGPSPTPWGHSLRSQNQSQRGSGPRFMTSSSSSSEEEDDGLVARSNARFHRLRPPPPHAPIQSSGDPLFGGSSADPAASGMAPGYQPLGRGRGLQGGYGYMPGSAESGLQVEVSNANFGGQPLVTNGSGISAFDSSSQQSQEEERLSPSIRSTAQVVSPVGHQDQTGHGQQSAANAGSGPARPRAYGGYPLPAASPPQPTSTGQNRSRTATSGSEDSFSTSSEGGLDAAARSDTGDSDYEMDTGNSAASGAGSRRKPKAANGTRKGSIGKAALASSAAPMYGNSLAGGASQHGNLTICEYISPLSGARCGTEFHRPYDLARHRETIHAKEEASLMRQGKLTKDQCRVLFVEVDPQRSQATQEWKCDGKNGCGSVFSRKDALQRHKRLRNH